MNALALCLALALPGHDHDGRPCRWRPDMPLGTPVTLRWSVAPDFALPGIDRPTARKLIRRAWSEWGSIAGIAAVESVEYDRANVVIRSGYVDGKDNIAAWGGFPCAAGTSNRVGILLDSGEDWDETKFRRVARHEQGHVCGLSHGPDGSWMSRYWPHETDTPHWWDIAEIEARYGAGDHEQPAALPRLGPRRDGLPLLAHPRAGPLLDPRLAGPGLFPLVGERASLARVLPAAGVVSRDRPGGVPRLGLPGGPAMSAAYRPTPGERCSRCGRAEPQVGIGPASGDAPLCGWCWEKSPPVVDDGEDDGPDPDLIDDAIDSFDDDDFDIDED